MITSINGRTIKDGDDLVSDISARKPGSSIQLGYLRDGRTAAATVTIGDRAQTSLAMGANDDENGPEKSGPDASQTKVGLTVTDLPSNAPSGLQGVLIQSVKPGSFADELRPGVIPGLVITAVNRKPVHNKREYDEIVSSLKSGADLVFEVIDPKQPKAGGDLVGGTLP